MNNFKVCFVVIALIFINNANAQIKNRFGAGFFYTSINGSGGGAFFEIKTLKSHLVMNGEFGVIKYANGNLNISAYYFPIANKQFRPFMGTTLIKTYGGITSWEEGPTNSLAFKVSPATYVAPYLGFRYDIKAYNESWETSKTTFAVFIKLGYKFILGKEPTVVQLYGTDVNGRFEEITKAIHNNVAFAAGVVYCWHTKF